MFFFKTIGLQESDRDTIEKAIRRYSIRRHTTLDLLSSLNTSFDKEKLFLGYETNEKIQFTRLRGPLDRYFPKFILVFQKNDFSSYQVRYSLISNLAVMALALSLLVGIVGVISLGDFSFIGMIIILSGIFFALSKLEYKLATQDVNIAISRWEKDAKQAS